MYSEQTRERFQMLGAVQDIQEPMIPVQAMEKNLDDKSQTLYDAVSLANLLSMIGQFLRL